MPRQSPTPEARQRAVRGSVARKLLLSLPADLDAQLRRAAESAPSEAEWVREAIRQRLEREGG